jgi:UPF0271 protein
MVSKLDINCDMGESFGNYEFGNDEKIMPYITSADLAAGFHAGDPHVMRETTQLAKSHDVNIGAHPGLPDLMGFGRRKMDISPQELKDYVGYQIGALDAFCRMSDVSLNHVKPHGAMYYTLIESMEHTQAFYETIMEFDEELICLVPLSPADTECNIYEVGEDYPLSVGREVVLDLLYDEQLNITVEQKKEAPKPDLIGERFSQLVTEGEIEYAQTGSVSFPSFHSVCVHGDNPNVVQILKEIHRQADHHGIELVDLQQTVE